MKSQENRFNHDGKEKAQKKGDGIMSASATDFVYNYGKKQENAKTHTVSPEKLEEIKRLMEQYLSGK